MWLTCADSDRSLLTMTRRSFTHSASLWRWQIIGLVVSNCMWLGEPSQISSILVGLRWDGYWPSKTGPIPCRLLMGHHSANTVCPWNLTVISTHVGWGHTVWPAQLHLLHTAGRGLPPVLKNWTLWNTSIQGCGARDFTVVMYIVHTVFIQSGMSSSPEHCRPYQTHAVVCRWV